ncbi:MAG: lipocalin-like domain-containing protein [Acidobacteriales bacterium]|nr:lipocalin-like domain-containing protein [Terriglobales bacterium]
MTTAADAQPKNRIAGTWAMVSAKSDPKGANRNLFGPNPSGQLIFTQDLRFTVVINNPTVPRFASSDRSKGTDAENKAAVAGALALYGTYVVDAEGRFAGEHVIGSTFPNWNGLNRTTVTLTETVEGDTMIEHYARARSPDNRDYLGPSNLTGERRVKTILITGVQSPFSQG